MTQNNDYWKPAKGASFCQDYQVSVNVLKNSNDEKQTKNKKYTIPLHAP